MEAGKGIKILKARLRNFGKFTDFVCEFFDGVTYLVGLNGSGKSTIGCNALMACINGISEKSTGGTLLGERFRFIGKNGKSADIEYEFLDETNGAKFTIKNHITAATNQITFKSDGPEIGEDWIKGFLNIALMSAKNFCALSGRQQAIELGIDTSSFEAEIKRFKEEATQINRDLKAFGEIVAVEKVLPVDVIALNNRKEEIRQELNAAYLKNKQHNKELRDQDERNKKQYDEQVINFNEQNNKRAEIRDKASEHLFGIMSLGYQGLEVQKWIDSLPSIALMHGVPPVVEPAYIEELPDDQAMKDIDAQLLGAMKTNQAAQEYAQYVKRCDAKAAKEKEKETNKAAQEEAATARNAYIKSHDHGFAGLTTDEDGNLLYNERPIREPYFSKGQLEMIVAKLHISRNPVFKVRFLDDFDLIDEPNQERILTDLLAAGFQPIVALVGQKSERENTLVLRECAIAGEEEEKPALL